MPFSYEDFDLSGIRTYPLSSRRSKATVRDFGRPAAPGATVGQWIESLPNFLGAADLRAVAGAVAASHRRDTGILWGFGAHVIKTGLAPVIIDLMDKVTSRSRILQRAMASFYYGLMFFILTSVLIAIVGLFNVYRWMPIPIGVIGIVYLFYGSLLMLRETRMANATINAEMDFTWQLARELAPKGVAGRYDKKGRIKGDDGPKVSKTLGGE